MKKKPAQSSELGVTRAGKRRACSVPTKVYTIEQVAEMLALSPRTIRRAIEHDRLIAHRFGGALPSFRALSSGHGRRRGAGFRHDDWVRPRSWMDAAISICSR